MVVFFYKIHGQSCHHIFPSSNGFLLKSTNSCHSHFFLPQQPFFTTSPAHTLPPKVFTHPNPVFFWKSMPNQHSSIGSLFKKFTTNTHYPHLFHLPSSWFPPNPWPILATQSFYPPQPAFLVKSPPSQHFFIGTTTILFIYPSSGFSQNLQSIPAIQSFYPSQQWFFVQNLCPTHIPPWFFPGQINPSRQQQLGSPLPHLHPHLSSGHKLSLLDPSTMGQNNIPYFCLWWDNWANICAGANERGGAGDSGVRLSYNRLSRINLDIITLIHYC